MIVDRTSQTVAREAALLTAKPRWSWNPCWYLWTGMQHVAYFVAPASGCSYCLAWRMFFIGLFVGAELMYFFPWLKVW